MQEPAPIMATRGIRARAILAAGVDGALDPADRDAVLQQLGGAIRGAAGTIISVSGQSLMAEFDAAQEAFACALHIQGYAGQARPVRIGVASDQADAGAMAPGAVVILAQQLRSAAPPGGIALSSALYAELFDILPLPATPMAQPILREMAAPVAAVTISAADCVAWIRGSDPPEPARSVRQDERITLAVVPFRATNSQVAGFADAVTDDAIRVLGGSSRWIGVTRAPMPTIWGGVDLRQVRQICDARYIMHGSAEQERQTLRLTVELNEAATGRVLWSDRFDNTDNDASALRDVCAPRIAGATALAVVQRDLERISTGPPGALSGHDIALRALASIMQPERTGFADAAQQLRQALQRPGPHHSTYFALVIWHLMALAQGWSDDPVADATAAITAAERLDRNDPASLALLGCVQAVVHRDHVVACVTLDRVIDQAPFCSMAWSMKARVLIQMGEGEEAVFHANQAEALPSMGFDRAWRSTVTALAYYAAERYADAARWARLAVMHYPGLAQTSRVLAASLVVLGQLDEAQRAAARSLAISPNFRIGAWRLQSTFSAEMRERYAQRLRLAGLPE